jgi:acrylyl-CoA reductase (NADPH)
LAFGLHFFSQRAETRPAEAWTRASAVAEGILVFRALVTKKDESGLISSAVEEVEESRLPEGNVTVAIDWAGFNYKDGLCLTGKGGLVRTYPHVAGVDFAGRVVDSKDKRYHPGQPVILTGWRVGETRWGGFSQRARVDADWLVASPKRLSAHDAMVLGTAGLTAMLAINRLKEDGVTPEKGEVLVTGAGGGVGSLAIMLLARLGYRVTAVTGRPQLADQLKRLGATTIIERQVLMQPSGKGLDKERFAGAIDPVGGPLLGEVLKKIQYGGSVAAIGLAGGATWEASVVPFILRSVALFGIDSVLAPYDTRVAAWDRLASLFVPTAYSQMVTDLTLADLPAAAERILKGEIEGRAVVNPRVIAI